MDRKADAKRKEQTHRLIEQGAIPETVFPEIVPMTGSSELRVQGYEFRVLSSGFRVSSSGFGNLGREGENGENRKV